MIRGLTAQPPGCDSTSAPLLVPGFATQRSPWSGAGWPAALLSAATAVAAAGSEQQLAQATVALAIAVTRAPSGWSVLTGPDGTATVHAHHGPPPVEDVSDTCAARSFSAVLSGQSLWWTDPTADPNGPTSSLGVPLRADGRVLGGLYLTGIGQGPSRAGVQARVTSVAELAAVALDRLRAQAAAGFLLDSLALLESRSTDPVPVAAFTTGTRASAVVRRLVGAARSLLGMQATFLSVIDGGRQTFLAVDTTPEAPGVVEGASIDASEGYCQLLLNGHIPAAVADVRAHPQLGSMPITTALGAGAYCGVPVLRADGSIFGTLCGLNTDPGQPPTNAQVHALSTIASLIGQRLDLEAAQASRWAAERAAFGELIAGTGSRIVVQPIVDLTDGRPVGYEALSRFTDPNGAALPPDTVFADARRLGLSNHLELAAAHAALALLPQLPVGTYLSVNLSPGAILDPAAHALLGAADLTRVVLEITEHEQVRDYAALRARLAPLRARSLRIAVDDTGAGFASLQHLVQLAPDAIKLDVAFVRDIDADPARRAIARAVSSYATEVGATLIAEGIETTAQAATLAELGAHRGQGYLYGHPAPLDQHIATPAAARLH